MTTAQDLTTTTWTVMHTDGDSVYFDSDGFMVASVGGPAPVGRTMLHLFERNGEGRAILVAAGVRYAHKMAQEHASR